MVKKLLPLLEKVMQHAGGNQSRAAEILGTDRLVFGCDMSMTAGMGKIRAARLSPEDKQKILGGNMTRLLQM